MAPRNASPPRGRPPIQRQLSHAKASLISPTPSAEADDERSSSSDSDHFDIEPAMGDVGPAAKYEGEDIRPTSRKELAGWYSYGWAAEVFAICAMASFLPIGLEQLARDQGVLLSDHKTPCNDYVAPPQAGHGPKHGHNQVPACVVSLFGHDINTASFAMYTFSLSVAVQALLIISMSGAADHGRFRKSFLLSFAFTGAVALMLFIFVVPKIYLFGAFLAIISNTCFGASFVLLNSFLPLLVRYHPSIQEEHATHQSEYTDIDERALDSDDGPHSPDSTQLLLPNDETDDTQPSRSSPAAISPELKLSTKLSSNGIGIGYIAGLIVQSLCIGVVVLTGQTTFSIRLVLFLIGLWWLLFSIPAALWLRPRPGPPLPASLSSRRNWIAYTIYAWSSLWKTIKQARRLKDIVIFLCAWFLVSDSIATVSGTAILFAKTSLGMKTYALALINVIGTIAGIIGAFYWSYFSRLLNLRASHTIVACICLFEVIPLYGLLGYIPAIRNYGVFGLQQPWEMYPLGAIYGFVIGGLSSYCRAFFGELIPPGFEAAFYALYAITDKGSSIFGPAIVGAITDRYGEIRPAFVFLAVLISLPIPLMMMVDVDRGKKDAALLAHELEEDREADDYSAIPSIRLPEDDD